MKSIDFLHAFLYQSYFLNVLTLMASQASISSANARYESALADEKRREEEEEAAKKIQENYRKYMKDRDQRELSEWGFF